jgi:hypothetical protein
MRLLVVADLLFCFGILCLSYSHRLFTASKTKSKKLLEHFSFGMISSSCRWPPADACSALGIEFQ